MSKNLTRKGLAFGALVALTSAGIATPAYAVDAITTALNSGTSFNTLTGYSNEITLKTNISADYSTPDATLKYRVVNAGLATIEAQFGVGDIDEDVDGTTGNIYEYTTTTPALTDADSSQASTEVQTADNDFVVALGTGALGDYSGDNLLALGVKDETTTDYTVTVQAWLDTNGNNTIDSTEYAAAVQTVKFYDEKSVTATATVLAPTLGATSVKAEIVTTPELNGQQLGTNAINAKWTTQGNANSVFADATRSSANAAGSTTYDGDTKKWTSTAQLYGAANATPWSGSALSTVDLATWTAHTNNTTTTKFYNKGAAHGLTVGAFATIASAAVGGTGTAAWNIATATKIVETSANVVEFGGFTGLTGVASGAAVTLSAGTLTYATKPAAQATVVAGSYSADAYIGTTTKLAAATGAGVVAATASNITATVAGTVTNTGVENSDASNASTVTVKSTTKTAIPVSVAIVTSTGAAVAANIPVTVTAGSPTGTYTVDGTSVTAAKTFSYKTDANGKIAFSVASSTAANGNTLTLTITAEGLTGASAAAVTVAYADATYLLKDLKDPAAVLERNVTTGGSVTFDLALVDQFGGILTSADYRFVVTTGGRTVSSNTYPLTAGKTSVVVPDNAVTGTTTTVDVDVQKKDANGDWGSDDITATNLVNTEEVEEWANGSGRRTINYAAASTLAVQLNASGATTYGGSAADLAGTTETTALKAVDNRLTNVDATQTGSTNISGRVATAQTQVGAGSQLVTISGPSTVYFLQGDVYAQGTLSFYATATTGVFDVVALSNVAQKDTVITVTSNGVSSTVKVTFAVATASGRLGTSLAVNAPQIVKSGRTLVITGTLTDKFGNGIDTDTSTSNAAANAEDNTNLDAGDARFLVTYTGPGFVLETLPLATDADGKFSVRVLLGSDETGLATLKVVYGGANGIISSTDTVANADITVSKSILVGTSASVSAGSKKANVVVKNAEGLTVKVVSGSKSTTKTATSDSYKLSLSKLTSGSKTVKVYVNDILVASKKVTVRR